MYCLCPKLWGLLSLSLSSLGQSQWGFYWSFMDINYVDVTLYINKERDDKSFIEVIL